MLFKNFTHVRKDICFLYVSFFVLANQNTGVFEINSRMILNIAEMKRWIQYQILLN